MRIKFTHVLIFFFFLLFFYFLLNDGFLLYGDLSTSFYYLSRSFLSTLGRFTWQQNSFLGYETSFYTLIRLPYYLLNDLINIINPNLYWLFFVVTYFLRYYLFYKMLKYFGVRSVLSVLISFAYAINFYFIDRFGHTLISFSSIAIPSLTTSYLELSKRLGVKNLLIFLFSLWVILSSMHVTLMTLYFGFILFSYSLIKYAKEKKFVRFLKNNLVTTIISVLVFSYITIPLFYSSFLSKNLNVINQVNLQLSEQIYLYSRETSIINIFIGTGFHASELTNMGWVVIISMLFFVPSISAIFLTKGKKRNIYYFFILSFFVFVFLSTIDFIKPFIPYLKNYLFGFKSIKDSSYFILYGTLSYFTLLALSLNDLFYKNKKVKRVGYVFLFLYIFFLVSVNINSFKKFSNLRVNNVPDSYYELSSYLPKEGRVVITPFGWVTRFEWSGGIMSGFFNLFMSDKEIIGQSIVEGPSIKTQKKIRDFTNCFNQTCDDIDRYIYDLNVTYFVNYKNALKPDSDLIDISKLSYDGSYTHLLNNGILYKIYSNEDYEIFEVSDKLDNSKFIAGKSYFQKINPTKYKLYLKNIDKTNGLVFLESFHNSWKIFLNQNPTLSWCNEVSERVNGDILCKEEDKSFELRDINLLLKRYYPDKFHDIYEDYANKWVFDSAYIKESYDRSYYKQNDDGTINLEITMYFIPQLYFYLGIVISIITLLLLVLFFILNLIIKRRKNTVLKIKNNDI